MNVVDLMTTNVATVSPDTSPRAEATQIHLKKLLGRIDAIARQIAREGELR